MTKTKTWVGKWEKWRTNNRMRS